MLEENKQCKNCGFDTMAIVTVETSNWKYCPVCGSGFVSVKDDIEGNVDEEDVKMRDVPLSGSPEDQSKKDSDDSDSGRTIELNSETSSDTDDTKSSQNKSDSFSEESDDIGNDDDLDDLMDDSDFVEDELSRLKRFVDDEDDED